MLLNFVNDNANIIGYWEIMHFRVILKNFDDACFCNKTKEDLYSENWIRRPQYITKF